jgi:hypothetical protein
MLSNMLFTNCFIDVDSFFIYQEQKMYLKFGHNSSWLGTNVVKTDVFYKLKYNVSRLMWSR